jgi:NAD(P)-dependent dehydrogenase (short-subunit alcohol dehydrogenase family)
MRVSGRGGAAVQDFTGKVAVITGGASGVGRSLAFALGRLGARIVVADVDANAMEAMARDTAAAGIETITQRCDVTAAADCEALADAALTAFGRIDLVFANAGVGAGEGGPMWTYSMKDWQWCFNVNVWGVVNTINAFMPRLVARNEEAHFVVTGSGNGAFVVLPDAPVYTASKAAVQAITENLYYQSVAMKSPVQVHALFPGPHVVDTGLFDSDRVRPEEFARAEAKSSGISSVDDMRRMMEQYGMELKTTHPDDVAQAAIAGIIAGKFWICPRTEESLAKYLARVESIRTLENPVVTSLG